MITVLQHDPKNKFTSFYCSGIPCAVLNALRRTLLLNIPAAAFTKVRILKNTTTYPNEVIQHRLSLIPINCNTNICLNLNEINVNSSVKQLTSDVFDYEQKSDIHITPDIIICTLQKGNELQLIAETEISTPAKKGCTFSTCVAPHYREITFITFTTESSKNIFMQHSEKCRWNIYPLQKLKNLFSPDLYLNVYFSDNIPEMTGLTEYLGLSDKDIHISRDLYNPNTGEKKKYHSFQLEYKMECNNSFILIKKALSLLRVQLGELKEMVHNLPLTRVEKSEFYYLVDTTRVKNNSTIFNALVIFLNQHKEVSMASFYENKLHLMLNQEYDISNILSNALAYMNSFLFDMYQSVSYDSVTT